MADYINEIKKRRTFAIISHPDAGKTTLTEKFLLYGGAIRLEDIRALGEHLGKFEMVQRVEILPYHTLGVHKYEAMGQEYKLQGVKENTPEQLDRAKALFDQYFKTVFVN